jgi:multiple sugar transport system permease protein
MKNKKILFYALAFILPNFLGFSLFTAGPVLFSLCASFTNWNLERTVHLSFIGLRNFSDLLTDHNFQVYFLNTIYLMLGIPVAIFGSLLLAVMLSQKLKGMTIYRTLFYLPTFTSGVALMILWKALFNPEYGPIDFAINAVFHAFHINAQAPVWLLSTKNLIGLDVERPRFSSNNFGIGAKDAMIIISIWTGIGGSNMLLYLAALTNVPPDLYEAASLDGASRWESFWNITVPQLAPTTFFICVMSIIGGFQSGFDQARVLTQGGPAGSTTTMSYFIYQKAFEQFQMGYSSAVSWILFLIILIMTALNWRFANQEQD